MVLASGCGQADVTGPERAVGAFTQAITTADGARACSVLSPSVAQAVADAVGAPCAQAVLQEDLPGTSPVRAARIDGRSAFVVTGTDTLFLSEFDDGWKVIGAGCRAVGDGPYDCTVSGG